jgi:ABC-type transport system involved in cytochrome c biogenesis permease subunit
MTHAHLTSLVLSLIFLIIIVVLQSKEKNIKIWHMVLRASYILIILTGGMLFLAAYSIPVSYYFKSILGIVMIGLFEMVIVRKQKGKRTDIIWIAFSIVLVILLVLGFTLPQGFDLIR